MLRNQRKEKTQHMLQVRWRDQQMAVVLSDHEIQTISETPRTSGKIQGKFNIIHATGKTCTYDTFKTWWIFLDLAWRFRYGGIYSSRFLLKSLHHEAPASASKEMSEITNQEANNDILRWTNYRSNMEMFAAFNKNLFQYFYHVPGWPRSL